MFGTPENAANFGGTRDARGDLPEKDMRQAQSPDGFIGDKSFDGSIGGFDGSGAFFDGSIGGGKDSAPGDGNGS